MKTVSLATTAVIGALCAAHAQDASRRPWGFGEFGPDARVIWTDSSASELSRQHERAAWQPAVNPEVQRGTALYAKVAPSVVVVRTSSGHGTGFIVDSGGLVLTNHHVVANSLEHDVARSASYANVHLGRIGKDGGMVLREQSVRAFLLKLDPAVDLALLKLASVPPDMAPLPALKFASAGPRPGVPATIIGHPASGMLWTMRSGEVASMGRMPADMVDLVMLQLSVAQDARQQAASEIKAAQSRRIILTSMGANPGDSGGPVVDASGAVIAVTFAVPSDAARAKFTYHIHLDELRRFMAKIPTAPILDVADPWQFGPRVDLQDLDGDGRPDVLMAGTRGPEQILFDLDNDTPAAAAQDRRALVRSRKWDFEFGLRLAAEEATSSAFYDTNNDGTVDLIQTVADDNHKINTQFTRSADGKWKVERNVPLVFQSPSLFQDPRLARRLSAFLKRSRSVP